MAVLKKKLLNHSFYSFNRPLTWHNSIDLPLCQWSKQGNIQNKQKFPKQQDEEFWQQL